MSVCYQAFFRAAFFELQTVLRQNYVNDIVSGRPTIVMPPGGPNTILALGAHYGASYFVLEPEGVLEEYQELYEQHDDYPGLVYLGEVDGAQIYALQPAE